MQLSFCLQWGNMEAVQKNQWYFMVLLIVLSFLKVASQQREDAITVALEEGMVLECMCPWDGNLSMVSWTKHPEKAPIAVFHPEYGVAFSHHYRERIEFLRTTPMDASITMKNITHKDTGLYHCSIQTFPQGSWTRNIQVDDLDEALPADDIIETPAPEVIEADMELVARRSDNLTISCNHEHNGTVYQVTMEKLDIGLPWGGGGGEGEGGDSSQQVGILGLCRVVDGGLVGEDYTQRGRVNCTDSLDISLQLTEVVEEDGGFYRCHFITDTGSQTTTVLLTLSNPGYFSLSGYMMYIYTGVGVAAILMLSVFSLLAMRLRKRNRREEYRLKLHPSQKPPNDYENIPGYRMGTRPKKQLRNCPIYTNIHTSQHQPKSYR